MSTRSSDRWLRDRARSTAMGLAALALAGTVGLGGAAAQGTPVTEPALRATPAAGPCQALDGATAPAAMAGTPEAAPAGTPVTDQAVTDAAMAAAKNLANCWNAGDLAAVQTLVTPNLLQTMIGDAALASLMGMAELPKYGIVSLENVQTYADGRASIDIVYELGRHQFTSARWYMVTADDALLIDQEELLLPQPEGDAAIISFSIKDDTTPVAFDQRSKIAPITVTTLVGINKGTERHVFQVVRLSPDFVGTPEVGAAPPADAEFVGMLSLAPGEQQELALIGLEAATYVLFDPAVPGSTATLVVAAPAA